jgi:hypothetical protein
MRDRVRIAQRVWFRVTVREKEEKDDASSGSNCTKLTSNKSTSSRAYTD